ncbi:MAG: hypothetical protein V7731_20605 [Amphritea sp.]
MRILRSTQHVIVSVLSGLCILAAAFPVLSAEQDSEEWSYLVVGSLFAESIDGTSGVGTPLGAMDVDVDLSFSDVIDNLDSAFSAIFNARKGRWSLNADVLIAKLEVDNTITSTPVPANMNVEIDIDEIELYAGYKFTQKYPNLEAIGGARYIKQDIDVDVIEGPVELNVDVGDDWIDPFVGLRYYGPINSEWSLLVRGDVGGFDVGSDFAWRFDAGVTYRFAQNWVAAFTYKVLDIDYENNNRDDLDYYKWDGKESGLLLGIGYHF